MFIRVLEEEEEGKTLRDNMPVEERPSTLIKQCKADGRMWFHHIIWEGFNGMVYKDRGRGREAGIRRAREG
jgi:hypothetical protein